MEYQIHLKHVESQTTAVVRRRAKLSELAQVVPEACGEVWEFVRSAHLSQPGRNLALYLLCVDDEVDLECGVEVSQPFAGDGRVFCSSTPAGMAATAVHMGPYEGLPEAYAAISKWCSENGYAITGPNWELYGHWEEDPAKLRADVFCLCEHRG